ncbi:type I restriction endonuclease subunit R [Pseudomonas aeruginosa]|uniref:type I restriction endonuclease subunit R n=1 Tax=Pseudomonas aeruginosa TaxID=287 RepID=UPI000BB8B508|nr:type I restriction endonuclease subunit R [Pseudomonas aeruginosa]EKY1809569.1 type I restriction endonuclease subunit R [Pseudomonas aeruginosa]MBI6969217.1 type I restriction endonuclease subunit R [Pseudomonas aeruginosa]MBV5917949.1 type I restriction endonuclease subunit R [Pseudomonas aeruginosa]MBX6224677.1 type I restriction endonuclease subunit R [Pseudomonas aeruginosa]MCO2995738.1 type I restriction endonuclease subunit R [Pseudomonas aeruginosa]
MEGFRFNEKYLSQIPALQVLINLGYTYLTSEQALAARGCKPGQVLLEEVLRERLKKNNRIQYKGQSYLFSEENIQTAIQRLKNVKYDGLLKTNEAIYDLLTLGVSLEQSIEGDSKSFTLSYIDWKNPANNDYHVTAEFPVERTRSTETCRPDIVLFVNGIPFAVIECKSPKVEIGQAVSQMIRNQREEYIPKLFTYTQLLIGVNKNGGQYATTGTPAKFWALWREQFDEAKAVAAAVNSPLKPQNKEALFSGDFAIARTFFDALEREGERHVTEQDRTLYSLCRPARLLDLALQFTVFDGGIRKVARYQQFFAIKRVIERVKHRDDVGRRLGGIIWHTQGSGKSLTMVMLARALALDPDIRNPRIVLVTDRVDLDKQLGNTFAACGLTPDRADSGRHLLELVSENKAHIVTTLIHKFDKALSIRKHVEESADIFILVDESHRTNFGGFAARMRQMFPMACYLGFTGTPLMKKEKNNFAKFGGLIDTYAINQAVKDGAVVPLLYEARHVEMEQNEKAIDTWFERHTQGLTDAQKADLKKKYSRAEMLNKADQVIYMRAFDISEHFRQNWKGTGFKAQLVAPSKAAALTYKKFLDEIGHVTSEVIISPPDTREGNEETDDEPTNEVVAFWERMMKRYGSEEEYNKQVINLFKHGDDPEILIVVDKLLTGFDAPRNTVLYLTRKLREHTLLQAIARVNRLYDDDEGTQPKEFGYIIDYAGILGELDQALTTYSALDGFDEADLAGALVSINEEVTKLPQRHADLWDLFKEVKNQHDEEAYEQLLADEKLRESFYERLAAYGKTLSIAMSSEQFIASTPEKKLQSYKNDLRRFTNLKASVKLRYAESVDYRDFEPKIKKLLDTHISASEVVRLNEPVNIFDEEAFKQVVEEQGETKATAAKADMIAHATKKAISERLEQDPVFYEKFSKLIQQAIDDFRAKRISDLEYLNKVSEIKDAVVNRRSDDAPAQLASNDNALALYGVLKPYVLGHVKAEETAATLAADSAVDIWSIIQRNKKVGFWDDLDAQRRTMNEIDDYLYDEVKDKKGVELTTGEMDDIIDRTMQLARHRMAV